MVRLGAIIFASIIFLLRGLRILIISLRDPDSIEIPRVEPIRGRQQQSATHSQFE